MNIGIFTYNFPHWKTQNGLFNLTVNGYKPKVIFSANPVELNFYKSKKRISPKDLYLIEPKKIAQTFEIPYFVLNHNSKETIGLVEKFDLDLGIILGARILKKEIIEKFKIGILNMHPGILPDNRGLDNIKWSILKDLPIGVTSHLINHEIDKGLLIDKQIINIYNDDTILDLHIRNQNLEQKMMIESIKFLEKNKNLNTLGNGEYFKSVPLELEEELETCFEIYKKKYVKI